MTLTPSYIEQNTRERERLNALVERLGDEDLRAAVNPDWTIAGVLGHIAFWDARALVLGRKLLSRTPFSPSDDEPEDVDWINDATRPLIEAIAPRAAAELAMRLAQDTDGLMASLTPELIARTWPEDPESPLNPLRAGHRGEHLDEIEAALAR